MICQYQELPRFRFHAPRVSGDLVAKEPGWRSRPNDEAASQIRTHFFAGFTLTSLLTSATLPPSRTIRLKLTLAVRLVVANCFSAAMTKWNALVDPAAKPCLSLVPPITHRGAWRHKGQAEI